MTNAKTLTRKAGQLWMMRYEEAQALTDASVQKMVSS
jgi:hypothetical protein